MNRMSASALVLLALLSLNISVGCVSTVQTQTVEPTAVAVIATATFVPTSTPSSTSTPTATAVPSETPTPTSTPSRTAFPTNTTTKTPAPTQTRTPTWTYQTSINTTFDNSHLEWYRNTWFFKQEDGGKIQVVNLGDYPDSDSPYAPKTSQILKHELYANILPNQDTFIFMSAEGAPIKTPLRVKVSVQFSGNFNEVVGNGYNGLISLFNDTKHVGNYWSQWATIGLRKNMSLDFSSFYPNGDLNFSKSSGVRVQPDKWFGLEILVDGNGYGYASVDEKLIASGQLVKMDKSYRADEGLSVLDIHAGAHTKGIKGGGYILNGPIIIESWAPKPP